MRDIHQIKRTNQAFDSIFDIMTHVGAAMCSKFFNKRFFGFFLVQDLTLETFFLVQNSLISLF